MRLDFSSFPLDVFNNPKCAELLNISELLPGSDRENQVSELVIEKTLLKTLKKALNVGGYYGMNKFISFLNDAALKKGLDCLIRDTISLIIENNKVPISLIRRTTAIIYVSIASVSNTAYQSISNYMVRVARTIGLLISGKEIDDNAEEQIMNELCSIYTLSLFLNIAVQLNNRQREEIYLLSTLSKDLLHQRQSKISFRSIEFPILFEDCMDTMPSYSDPSLVYYLFRNNKELKDWAIYKDDTVQYLYSFVEDYCDNWAKYKIL